MNAKLKMAIAVSLALTAGTIGLFKGTSAMAKTYHMLFSGDAGASFNGTCTIATSGGETVLTLEGQVPHEQEVVGHGMKCRLEASGRVVIDIEHGGSRTRSATNGGTINIGLR